MDGQGPFTGVSCQAHVLQMREYREHDWPQTQLVVPAEGPITQ